MGLKEISKFSTQIRCTSSPPLPRCTKSGEKWISKKRVSPKFPSASSCLRVSVHLVTPLTRCAYRIKKSPITPKKILASGAPRHPPCLGAPGAPSPPCLGAPGAPRHPPLTGCTKTMKFPILLSGSPRHPSLPRCDYRDFFSIPGVFFDRGGSLPTTGDFSAANSRRGKIHIERPTARFWTLF